MKPVVLRLGFALALSFAGYFFSQLRSRPRLPPPPSSSGSGSESGGKPASRIKDEIRILESEEALAKIIKDTSNSPASGKDELCVLTSEEALAKITNGTSITTPIKELSPSSRSSEDEVKLLLPEFDEVLLRELETYREATSPMTMEFEIKKEVAMEQEIAYLKNLVESLQEKERSFEIQMLEYYGIKEQESSLRELENRLKVSTVEAKLLSLKIESLQADNQMLQAQVADYPRIKAELDSEREKIKFLKRKLKSDGEQAKEKLAALYQRIAELQDSELKDGEEVEKKLTRLKDMEDEKVVLQKVNLRLSQENSELAKELESAKMTASSDLKRLEVELLEEASFLREENEKLKKEIEELQNNRCADVEELVYLRWVNACLRYELRNYQPSPGKAAARDLSMSLSPKSEERAKQLILEYGRPSIDDKNMSLLDFESEYCSSSQASTEEFSDTSFDASSTTKNSGSNKLKFYNKLKKLVLGKDSHKSKVLSFGDSRRGASISTCSFEDVIERNSCHSISANQLTGVESNANEQWHSKLAHVQNISRSSLDCQRTRRLDEREAKEGIVERCNSDVGTSYASKKIIPGDDSLYGLSQNISINHEVVDAPENVKLKKFAEALNSSRGPLKSKRRVASFDSS